MGEKGGGGDDVQLPPVPVRSLGWLVVCCLVAYLFFEDCGVCVPVSFARMPCQSMRSRSLLCVCDFFRALINSLCCRKAASFLQDLRAASVGVTLLSRAGSGAQLSVGGLVALVVRSTFGAPNPLLARQEVCRAGTGFTFCGE